MHLAVNSYIFLGNATVICCAMAVLLKAIMHRQLRQKIGGAVRGVLTTKEAVREIGQMV